MKRLMSAFLLVAILSTPAVARDREVVVLTSLEVMQVMGEALTVNTSITVRNTVPAGYSMRGQDAFFKKHHKRFFETAATADAVLTVGSAWPGDPLYKWARRGNIRIVNIDAARPLDAYGAGVPLVMVEGQYSPFVWRSPANLTRMASIVSDDLCRLAPRDAVVIRENLRGLQTVLFQLRSRYEAAFLKLDAVELAAFTDGYTYLADEFGLDIRFYVLTPETRWGDEMVEDISTRLRRAGVKAVVCPWEPDQKGSQALRDGGAVPVVLESFKREVGVPAVEALVGWYEGNLSRLVTGLDTGSEE